MDDLKTSPATRAYAARNGVDLQALAAETGRTTIGREDVDAKIGGADKGDARIGGANNGDARIGSAAPGDDPAAYWDVDHARYGPVEHEPVSRLARVAAKNLAAAQAMIPAVTHHDRADTTALDAFRARLAPDAAARGLRLTALAFHVRALARTLRRHPRFNASLSPDGETLILKRYVHVGIAVDTPHGLMVPVIRDADRKGLWRIAAEIDALAAKARDRKLRPDEMGGASMTISNLGGIGGSAFTPIVNPPEVAILGLTRTQTETAWHDGTPRPVPMLPLDLSYDHRVINGADAAKFLADLKTAIEKPETILV
ncbi:2-oxo acid dehydrogenase subunit E2 [Tranquillimonas rosea]|uniref:2-oxo acid dehydrogenase subunit E2 n=1 Tax=Tranquillimonas rosea TaxID=641238 RepID=UPI003BAA56FC